MSYERKEPVELVVIDDLALAAGVVLDRNTPDVRLAERLTMRAALTPTAGLTGGRGVRRKWPATDAVALRVIARLATQGCPDVWLAAVAAWWRRPGLDPNAVAGRVVAVVPQRDPAVFVTTRNNIGPILGGRDGWIVDLGVPIATPRGTRG